MNKVISADEILDGVRQDLADCCGIEVEEVGRTSMFSTDLDGESIDVIDLMFRCEKRFGVRIELQSLMTELEFGSDGCLSQESIRYLQEKIPEIDWSARVAGIRRSNALDILTADLICELVGAAMRSGKGHSNVPEARS